VRDRESGQATTEFALILIPMLIIVVGIIYFGIALNYWLDMQKIANQGARWAAVNCGQSASTPVTPNPCSPVAGQTLQQTLRKQVVAGGEQACLSVQVAFPEGTSEVGDPVQITLRRPFKVLPFVTASTLQLGAHATMRLEWKPTAYSSADNINIPC